MRKALRLLLGFWLTFTATNVFAQKQTVSGRVLDATDQSALPGANVLLIHLPDSAKQGVATDPGGNFSFTEVAPGRYLLTISFVSYQTQRRPVTVVGSPVVLGGILLGSNQIKLGEVEITGRAAAAVQKGDTAEFNARAFKTNPDANAQDLVTKMPGVTVQDGRVQAQGENVQRILVDGKPFFGDDPDAVLKNIPAEMIDKIQVLDRQSEQSQFSGFNDGNTEKTINIVTKPEFKTGQFGRFVAGAGPERYRVSGNYNSFEGDRRFSVVAQSNNINEQNFATDDLLGVASSSGGGGGNRGGGRPGGGGGGRPGGGGPGGGGNNAGDFLVSPSGGISTTHAIGLNYSDVWNKKTQVTGSYFFNLSENRANTNLFRQFALADGGVDQTYTENSLATSRNINHRFNLRLEHKIDSANSILFRPRLSLQQNRGNSNLDGFTAADNISNSNVLSDYRSALTGLNSNNDLLYRHRFNKPGRTMSANATVNYNQKQGDNNLLTRSETDSLNQFSTLDQSGWNLGTRLEYTEPLTKQDLLQFNYTLAYTPNDSDKRTFDFVDDTGEYAELNPALSNVFTNTYLTQGLGVSFRHQTKDLQVMVGASGQKADLRSDQEFPLTTSLNRSFYNFLPNAMLRYNFSREKNLRFFYRSSTPPPSIGQLQEVVNNANPLQLTTGNPALEQQTQHSATIRYSAAQPGKSTTFFALLLGNFTDNYITNSTFIATEDTELQLNGGVVRLPAGGQLTRPINLGQQYNFRGVLSYGMPVGFIKSNLNLNATAGYSRTPGLINDVINYSQTPTLGLGAVVSSNISERLDFTVSSNSNFSRARNTARTQLNTNYFTQNSQLRFNWIVGNGFTLQTDLTHRYNGGLAEGFNQQYALWNASIGKKIFEKQRGEIRLYAFDMLGQNRSIQRNVTEAYIEDTRTDILQRYFMVMFTYNLRSGTGSPSGAGERPERGGPGGAGSPR
ncbi:TonB-dependent receptor [Hymenobacter sp. BT188]|uniref:outer membrane beta-barrel protein n=1 Tax=Hymenobacter sp. BT188 TaxID=2763504 RepID=UPI0016518C6A|nr:outer membrane beta-barrel protein [Hymenobacter sp. BT188]MBC6606501.1 TonB-dependent receptor [Hymenobacter sp. BT188]